MNSSVLDRNLALEAVRVTEAAALSSSLLMGKGDEKSADQYIKRLKTLYSNEFKIEPDCYNLKIVEGAMIES